MYNSLGAFSTRRRVTSISSRLVLFIAETALPFFGPEARHEDDVRVTRHGEADDEALSAARAGTSSPYEGDRGAEFGVALPATKGKGSLLVIGLLHGRILRETRARRPGGIALSAGRPTRGG